MSARHLSNLAQLVQLELSKVYDSSKDDIISRAALVRKSNISELDIFTYANWLQSATKKNTSQLSKLRVSYRPHPTIVRSAVPPSWWFPMPFLNGTCRLPSQLHFPLQCVPSGSYVFPLAGHRTSYSLPARFLWPSWADFFLLVLPLFRIPSLVPFLVLCLRSFSAWSCFLSPAPVSVFFQLLFRACPPFCRRRCGNFPVLRSPVSGQLGCGLPVSLS